MARKRTGLETKREIVDQALELLVQTETRHLSLLWSGHLERGLESHAQEPRLILVDRSAWMEAEPLALAGVVSFTLDKDFFGIARRTGFPLHFSASAI